jgi:hypothetical protein
MCLQEAREGEFCPIFFVFIAFIAMPTLKAFEGRKRPFCMIFLFCLTLNILLILDISKDPLFGIARLWDNVARKPLP